MFSPRFVQRSGNSFYLSKLFYASLWVIFPPFLFFAAKWHFSFELIHNFAEKKIITQNSVCISK